MAFLALLRKLGIFRSGTTAGTYRSAKDRPTELQMDDVFDAKKDLVQAGHDTTDQSIDHHDHA